MNTNLRFLNTIFIIATAIRTVQLIDQNFPLKSSIKSDSRIVGGTKALINEFPYQVSVQINGYHVCGGSIISKKWVLTAAHCVQNVRLTSLKIRSGSTFITHGGTIHLISKIVSHEFYNETEIVNDIALIRVKIGFKWGRKRRITKLIEAKKKIRSGTLARIIGWGVKSEGDFISWSLQKTNVPIISSRECRKILYYLSRGQICAGYKSGGYDACQGDSGGPLVVDDLLVGIVSWGEGCARPGKPGVYTEVAYYREWIKKICSC